jgi:hypothetical protein
MSNGNTANTQADNMNTDERRGVKRRREDETDEQNTIDLTKSESKPQLSRAESALAFRNGTGPVLAGSRSINEFEKIAEIGDGKTLPLLQFFSVTLTNCTFLLWQSYTIPHLLIPHP